MPRNRKRKKITENETKKRELHELPYTEVVKSGTIQYTYCTVRLISGVPLKFKIFIISNCLLL